MILEARDNCLIAGISEADFWEMTVGEAGRAIDAYNERRRDKAYFDYTQAMTIGAFIGSMFSSKAPPKLEEIYPDFFGGEDKEELEQAEQERRDEISAANFIKFANAFNRNYENGDRKSESENNG